jgi:L-lactate dehydrogenase complex protein LldG
MGVDSRSKILSRIKRGLSGTDNANRSGSEPIGQDIRHAVKHSRGKSFDTKLGQTNQSLIEMFTNELDKVDGQSKILNKEDQVSDYLSDVTIQHNSKSCIVWETDLIKQLNIIEYLKSTNLRVIKSHHKKRLARADIGITEADYAIADSGTLVLLSNPKQPRLVSLIAPIHIAILDSERIVPNIFDLFQIFTYKSEMSCIAFITGPSRTADIELNLTLGVHGPKEVHILIYNK